MSTMEAKSDTKHPIRHKLRPRLVTTPDKVVPASAKRDSSSQNTNNQTQDVEVDTLLSMLSPRRPRGKEFTSLVSKRITPHGRTSSSASKYVITPHTPQMPHTPQERDVGLTLAALARNSKAGGSSVPSTDEKSSGSRVTYSLTFPELVHKMVTETVQRNSQIIRWTHDGEAFSVNHKHKKLGKILLKYFRHGKYGSLQRQLNMYGWKKQVLGKYTGSFYNPEFHRDTHLSQIARIKRRPPPLKQLKKPRKAKPRRPSSRKAVSNFARKETPEQESDGDWVPKSSTRTPSKTKQILRGAKDVSKQLTSSENINSAAAETPGKAFAKAGSVLTPTEKLFQQGGVSSSGFVRHTGSTLLGVSRGRSNMTPGNFKDGLMNFDSISPFTPMSPFMGRLIRHESTGSRLGGTSYRTPADAYWHQMGGYPLAHTGIESHNHPGAAVIPPSQATTSARTFHMAGSSGLSPWLSSPLPVAVGRTQTAPSPSEVFSSAFGQTVMPPPLASVPPLFSRESSATFAPAPLVQRVSSSFYLPFVGLTDSLTSALATSPIKPA